MIYRKEGSDNDVLALQTGLSEIEKRCVEWKLALNVKKRVHLSFFRGSKRTNFPYFLYNKCVSEITQVKGLRTVFSCNYSWEGRVNSIVYKASSMLKLLQ